MMIINVWWYKNIMCYNISLIHTIYFHLHNLKEPQQHCAQVSLCEREKYVLYNKSWSMLRQTGRYTYSIYT